MKESFRKGLHLTLIDANLPQIMQKYGDDIEARLKEEHLDKTHNPEPLKDTLGKNLAHPTRRRRSVQHLLVRVWAPHSTVTQYLHYQKLKLKI